MLTSRLKELLMRLSNDRQSVIVDRPAPPLIYAHSLKDESFNEIPPLSRDEFVFLFDSGYIRLVKNERYIYEITDKGRILGGESADSVWPL